MIVARESGSAFGLQLQSDIRLSGLTSAGAAFPRLAIEKGDTATYASAYFELPNYRCGDGWTWLKTSRVGEVLAIGGNKLVYKRARTCDEAALSNYLLGCGLATILKQRSGIVLPGSAVVWRGGAYLLLGRGAVGKSALSARLTEEGCTLLSDDVVNVKLSTDGRAIAIPGLSTVKLWPDSIRWLQKSWPDAEAIRHNHAKLRCDASDVHYRKPSPVAGIFILKHSHSTWPALSSLRTAERLAELAAHASTAIKPTTRARKIATFKLLALLANIQKFHSLSRNMTCNNRSETYDLLRTAIMEELSSDPRDA